MIGGFYINTGNQFLMGCGVLTLQELLLLPTQETKTLSSTMKVLKNSTTHTPYTIYAVLGQTSILISIQTHILHQKLPYIHVHWHTFEALNRNMSDKCVKLVGRIFILVPFTGTSHSNPEWDIAAIVEGLYINSNRGHNCWVVETERRQYADTCHGRVMINGAAPFGSYTKMAIVPFDVYVHTCHCTSVCPVQRKHLQ